ncbi:MAG: hypothetical protein HLUCCA04_09925 [Oceanicaulis sp. HLUCCA04]|nr:MAG: hypothetical protein HLUCCA04_09925 [Oceanicaulis sp. HLUCCA04]
MRFLLTIMVLFVLPFAGYYTWRGIKSAMAARRADGDAGGDDDDATGLPPAPLQVLALVGAGLAITGILALALGGVLGGSGQTGQFHPPALEDGRLVPGRIDPPDDQ